MPKLLDEWTWEHGPGWSGLSLVNLSYPRGEVVVQTGSIKQSLWPEDRTRYRIVEELKHLVSSVLINVLTAAQLNTPRGAPEPKIRTSDLIDVQVTAFSGWPSEPSRVRAQRLNAVQVVSETSLSEGLPVTEHCSSLSRVNFQNFLHISQYYPVCDKWKTGVDLLWGSLWRPALIWDAWHPQIHNSARTLLDCIRAGFIRQWVFLGRVVPIDCFGILKSYI